MSIFIVYDKSEMPEILGVYDNNREAYEKRDYYLKYFSTVELLTVHTALEATNFFVNFFKEKINEDDLNEEVEKVIEEVEKEIEELEKELKKVDVTFNTDIATEASTIITVKFFEIIRPDIIDLGFVYE